MHAHLRTTLGGLLAAGLVLGLAVDASAQGSMQEAQARRLFEQGVTEMNAGRPGSAAQYFQQSYQLAPRASSACNMALALERTSRQCEARDWYRQCAALDTAGRFRDHANRQAAALAGQCDQGSGAQNPFVSGPGQGGGGTTPGTTDGGVQVVEGGGYTDQGSSYQGPGPDHTFLIVGIVGLVVGGVALTGSILTAEASNNNFNMIDMLANPPGTPENPAVLAEGSADAGFYNEAQTLRNVSIGLAVGAALAGGLGLIFVIVDLAQPGVFGGSARSDEGPRFTLGPRPEGGAEGALTLRF